VRGPRGWLTARPLQAGHHPLLLEAAHHEPHVAGHPARRKESEPLLERCQIIAPIADLSAEHLGPDAGDRFAGESLGTDQFDRLARPRLGGFFPFEQGESGGLRDVARVDHRDALAADRLRIDALAEQRVLHGGVVLDEVIRPENRHGQSTVFDHPLDRVFTGEMRNIGEDVAVEHREVHNALDAGLLGEAEREQGLGKLVRGDGVQQKSVLAFAIAAWVALAISGLP
jgi:hypothetical protein